MNVTSLELSKELYELSGWKDQQNAWAIARFEEDDDTPYVRVASGESYGYREVPAYDLGYLLRKLPKRLPDNERFWLYVGPFDMETWAASYMIDTDGLYINWADTVEDAAAKLAIELFKQGVLTRDGDE